MNEVETFVLIAMIYLGLIWVIKFFQAQNYFFVVDFLLKFSSFPLSKLLKNECKKSGADLGGGRTPPPPPPSGSRPPADPKGPPFDTFSEINFWPTDPKVFLKAPWAPIYTNFEGARAKKTRFF